MKKVMLTISWCLVSDGLVGAFQKLLTTEIFPHKHI